MITHKLTHMHAPTHNTTCLVVKFPFQLFIPWELRHTLERLAHVIVIVTSLTPYSMWVACPVSGPSFYSRIQNLFYTLSLGITWNVPVSKISLHFFHSINHIFNSLNDYHYHNSYLGCFLSTSYSLIEPISCEITLPSPTFPHPLHNNDFSWRKNNTRQLTCCCHFKYTVVKY